MDIEVDYDETGAEEMQAIADMVERSDMEGLLVEVVWSFGRAQASGDSIKESCFFALNEWDI